MDSVKFFLVVAMLVWTSRAAYNDDNKNHIDLDPDVFRNFTEIVQSNGYPCEFHQVTTDDGYILGLFHVPYGITGDSSGNRPVVFLQHGLMDWAYSWIFNIPHQSLAYILADNGYDVWMGNNRGTLYSRDHVQYSTHDREFWEFSYDQFATHDLAAMLDYVLQSTKTTQLSYIGHSQGTTQMFAALSQPKTMIAQKLNLFIGLGPVTTVSHTTAKVLHLLADKHVGDVLLLLGLYQFPGPAPSCMSKLLAEMCHICAECCDNVIFLICGRNKGDFNNTRMEVMGAHEPGDTSTLNVNHWAQAVRGGVFQKYDFGRAYNKEFYGQEQPPVYDMNNIPSSVPIALISGGKDKLADPQDVALLAASIPGGPVFQKIVPEYAHLDFVWAIDAYQKIYPDILSLLAKYN